MSLSNNRVAVQGSERPPLPGANIVSRVNPDERIQVTALIRRPQSAKELTSMIEDISARKPQEREYLSRDEFAANQGAAPEDLEKVEEFAHEYGLDVVEVNAAQRRVVLAGTASALSEAFGVDLAYYKYPGGTYRGRTGSIYLPEDLAPIVTAVLGLDNRPQARSHSRFSGKKEEL